MSNDWIPVIERLPEEMVKVLVCSSRGGFSIAEYRGKLEGWYRFNTADHTVNPVAWIKLPEPYRSK